MESIAFRLKAIRLETIGIRLGAIAFAFDLLYIPWLLDHGMHALHLTRSPKTELYELVKLADKVCPIINIPEYSTLDLYSYSSEIFSVMNFTTLGAVRDTR